MRAVGRGTRKKPDQHLLLIPRLVYRLTCIVLALQCTTFLVQLMQQAPALLSKTPEPAGERVKKLCEGAGARQEGERAARADLYLDLALTVEIGL